MAFGDEKEPERHVTHPNRLSVLELDFNEQIRIAALNATVVYAGDTFTAAQFRETLQDFEDYIRYGKRDTNG